MSIVMFFILLALLLVILVVQFLLFQRSNQSPGFEKDLKALQQQQHNLDSAVRDEFARNRNESGTTLNQFREEMSGALWKFSDATTKTISELGSAQRNQLELFGKQIEAGELRLSSLRMSIEEQLKQIQADNTKQLEQMRQTVDEKLQGTLEKRLSESFRLVSERLEAVTKGLGEMQVLAAGVGDLKKVLTNVKTRGTWGEIQLGAMLSEVLHPEQFATNVAVTGSNERVEFAIKLPGRMEGETVWLPMDAKFPVEDYQRLIDARDNGDNDNADVASKQLEIRLKACASDIRQKYVSPPKTTDFGILYLPTEGLFAEVVRRTGLTDLLQREYRVIVAGPTTLWAILNSLQMGFQTLMIEKRSSEVWNLLAAVKTEWLKYEEVFQKVRKKLTEVTNTIDDADKRTRAIGRKLRDVHELPGSTETIERDPEI